MKKVFGILAASATSNPEQEVQMLIADVAIGIYAADTALHRTRKIAGRNSDAEIVIAMFRTFLNDEIARVTVAARQVLAAIGGPLLGQHLSEVESLLRWVPLDTLATRRKIAASLLG
jgi:hypothetical protein